MFTLYWLKTSQMAMLILIKVHPDWSVTPQKQFHEIGIYVTPTFSFKNVFFSHNFLLGKLLDL